MIYILVYNNLFVFLEPVDELRPTYACGQFMQVSSTVHNKNQLNSIIVKVGNVRDL